MDENTDLTKAIKQAKKIGWFKWVAIKLFYVLLLAVPATIAGYFGGKTYVSRNINNITQTVINNFRVESPSGNDLSKQGYQMVQGSQEDSRDSSTSVFGDSDWEIDPKRIKKVDDKKSDLNGFYCVKESESWDSGEIWYEKEEISIDSKITLRYLIKNDPEVQSSREPELIFVFGEQRDFRMFIPDKDSRFIGFEDKTIRVSHKPKRLPMPVDTSKEADLEITISNPSSNQALFAFTLKYIPVVESEEEEATQQIASNNFSSVFPWPNPKSEGAKQKIGIGAFNGGCFKISYFNVSSS